MNYMLQGSELKQTGVAVQLDKERTLLFDLNAICELETAYGSIQKAFELVEKGKMKVIRKMLWCALIHEDENLTELQVGKWLTLDGLGDIAVKLVEAFGGQTPEQDEEVTLAKKN